MRRASLCLMLALVASTSWGADITLQSKQQQARQQQAELRERIQGLQKKIESTEASRSDASVALKESENAISVSDRRLAELEQRSARVKAHINELNAQIKEQDALREQRQHELAEQLRALHSSGLSPWAALLSGDNPQAIQRELGYLSYVSKAQAEKVRALRRSLEKLAALQADANASRDELVQLASETKEKKAELLKQQAKRVQVLAEVEDELKKQRSQASGLESNESRLSQLITGLDVEIARQAELARQAEIRRQAEAKRRAEEARLAEIARREREAQQVAEARRVAEQQRQQAEMAAAQQTQLERDKALAAQRAEARRLEILAHSPAIEEDSSTPATAAKAPDAPPAAPKAVAVAPPAPRSAPPEPIRLEPEGGFKGLQRGLAMPVRGEVQGRFGADRPEGGKWRGIVIRASEGTVVNSVAAGRVVYASWLRGFGNLVIVDHGGGHLTVYGYNQSLLKQVGDVVTQGEAIARVGATGGQVEPGLYFEIRHNGQPINPQLWLRG
ncbi:peptidoglycan DD-metalloendopeptidase family protein [Paenalcaligenes niemegkensis]|uniref:peptidoglycan DD-metalloendopeptidase family protein n=1 Tax=Paenalcaligenes niemegkensis TaxID=2895469 RepID=UPI001EE852CC|nr:peptidoglycan DD-metalloendopeptidase family protein [Paenalcaligenes niemegkensis]